MRCHCRSGHGLSSGKPGFRILPAGRPGKEFRWPAAPASEPPRADPDPASPRRRHPALGWCTCDRGLDGSRHLRRPTRRAASREQGELRNRPHRAWRRRGRCNGLGSGCARAGLGTLPRHGSRGGAFLRSHGDLPLNETDPKHLALLGTHMARTGELSLHTACGPQIGLLLRALAIVKGAYPNPAITSQPRAARPAPPSRRAPGSARHIPSRP